MQSDDAEHSGGTRGHHRAKHGLISAAIDLYRAIGDLRYGFESCLR